MGTQKSIKIPGNSENYRHLESHIKLIAICCLVSAIKRTPGSLTEACFRYLKIHYNRKCKDCTIEIFIQADKFSVCIYHQGSHKYSSVFQNAPFTTYVNVSKMFLLQLLSWQLTYLLFSPRLLLCQERLVLNCVKSLDCLILGFIELKKHSNHIVVCLGLLTAYIHQQYFPCNERLLRLKSIVYHSYRLRSPADRHQSQGLWDIFGICSDATSWAQDGCSAHIVSLCNPNGKLIRKQWLKALSHTELPLK